MPADKYRIYLTLNHRFDFPGYHWAILLAPKDVQHSVSEELDSTRWDVTNLSNNGRDLTPWRYRETQVNQFLDVTLCARLILAKVPGSDYEATYSKLRAVMESLAVSDDIDMTSQAFCCRTWTLDAIQALKEAGIVKLKMPVHCVDAHAKKLGEEAMVKIQKGVVDISAGDAIPTLDIRRAGRNSLGVGRRGAMACVE